VLAGNFVKENLAFFGHFSSQKRKQEENIFLEEGTVKGVGLAHSAVEKTLDMIYINLMLHICEITGFSDNFHMKEESEYTFLLYEQCNHHGTAYRIQCEHDYTFHSKSRLVG